MPRLPFGAVLVLVGFVLGAWASVVVGAVAPARAEAPACEDRSARALEALAEQSRRQTAALERIAERLRK